MSHLKSVKQPPGGSGKLPVFKIKGDYSPVPAGEYTVQITEIKSDKYKGIRDCFKFTFEIVEGPYVGRLLSGWVNYPTGKDATVNTKLVRWYQIAKGHEMAEDDVVDLDSIIGSIVLVQTKINDTKFNNKFSNVSEILKLVQGE